MVCPACGTAVAAEGRFCPRCGAETSGERQAFNPRQGYNQQVPAGGYAPPMYPALVPRVQRNLQPLGILWCVYGAYRAIGGLVGMFFLQLASMGGFGGFGNGGWPYGNHWSHWNHGPVWLAALVPFVGVYTVMVTGLALLVGYGLLTRRPWGRTLAIVAAILALFRPLLGTGLGIYTLWVLAPAQSGAEFDAIADRG